MMESPQAAFVTMVMDRLHAVEEQNQSLAKENERLKVSVQQLQFGLYLKERMNTFSDGFLLLPGFGVCETKMQPPWVRYKWDCDQDLPLDERHADALAFVGKASFDFDCPDYNKKLVLGETGKRTTVVEFVTGVDAWCKEYLAADPMHETESLRETCFFWTLQSYDPDSERVFWKLD